MSKTVISTISLNSGKELNQSLLNMGLNVVSMPMIEIAPAPADSTIKNTILNISKFNILVFTSRNGVNCFFRILKELTGTYSLPGKIKIAVIGAKTAGELSKYGHKTGLISEVSSSTGLLDYLKKEVITKEDKILLALGKLAPDYLLNELNRVAYTERVDVYNTVMPDFADKQVLKQIKKGDGDLILFSSPSAFSNFIGVTGIKSGEETIPIATIGETTAGYIREKGFVVSLVASNPGHEIFSNEILNYLNKH
jgi:uroporphyrinogen-III synthase